uniref:Uncharacterized protein n=1 Tax=viral metagenome TaxID=1070528 RepID=A0A6C0CFS4_9ZZZZ
MDIDELGVGEKYDNLIRLRRLIDEVDEYSPETCMDSGELIQQLIDFFNDIRKHFPDFNNITNPNNLKDIDDSKKIAEEMAKMIEDNLGPWEDDDTIKVFKQFLLAVENIVQGTCVLDDIDVEDIFAELTIPMTIK